MALEQARRRYYSNARWSDSYVRIAMASVYQRQPFAPVLMMAELAAGYLAAHQMQSCHHFVMQPASAAQGLPSYSHQDPFELRVAFHSDPVL
ncbi:MAG: hypothetical protein M3Y76_14240, partial [Chloroflexota bacterium]|nr:hypothetical protein [Chloroflexota bacterium]